MRAKDFLLEADKTISITVPINITIPSGDNEPSVNTPDDAETEVQPIFVPPLQQHIEMVKKSAGKDSTVFDQLTADDYKEPTPQEITPVSAPTAPANSILRQKFSDLQARLQQALKSLG